MDTAEVLDLIDDIEASTDRAFSDRARDLEALADRLEPGAPGRADALLAAAGSWEVHGDLEEALRLVDLAEADGGATETHPTTLRLSLALARDDEGAVAAITAQLRDDARGDALSVDDYLEVGELFEEHGRLPQALRWFTLPYTYADPDDPGLDVSCLAGRLRVRTALGKPRDRFDQVAVRRFPALGG